MVNYKILGIFKQINIMFLKNISNLTLFSIIITKL